MDILGWKKLTVIIFGCLLLAGCSKSLPNTYQEGSDYQYMEKQSFYSFHQVGEKADYFAHDHYIYYMDKEKKELLPLCGKADCLHDKETDLEKIQGCNAYMKAEDSSMGIAYCNGYLYYIEDFSEKPALYRLSEDGTKKEQVYEWEGNIGVEQWIIHRDVLYYAEHCYLKGENGTKERYAMKALSLAGNVKKPETVMKVDENLVVFSVAHPEAYGNFLYFQVHAQKETEEEVTDDNYLKYQYMKTFIYDINGKKVKELTLPDMGKDEAIQGVAFWQGRILFTPYNPHLEFLEPVKWYAADLDGSNIEVFMENIGQGLLFLSDGKYLYLSNLNMVSRGYDKGEGTYKIYDKDLNLVDTVKVPFKPSFGDVAIGTSKYMYFNYVKEKSDKEAEEEKNGEEVEWGVSCWDKSKIGSYHRDAFDMTDIKYEG